MKEGRKEGKKEGQKEGKTVGKTEGKTEGGKTLGAGSAKEFGLSFDWSEERKE